MPIAACPTLLLCAPPLVDPQQQLQIGLVRQLLCRRLVAIQMNYVHILQVSELSCYHSAHLPTLHTNLLPFCECHAQNLALFFPAEQWLYGDTR